jgi:hypothetical protein
MYLWLDCVVSKNYTCVALERLPVTVKERTRVDVDVPERKNTTDANQKTCFLWSAHNRVGAAIVQGCHHDDMMMISSVLAWPASKASNGLHAYIASTVSLQVWLLLY